MKSLIFTLLALLVVQSAIACSATAGFSNSNTSAGNNLLQITFTNSSSVSSLTSVQYAQYEVYFGDGTHAFVGYGGNVSHNYSSAGTYTASMVARGIDSSSTSVMCSDSITTSVTVSYPPCGSTISVVYGSGGAATLTATTPAGTTGMSYSWNYGDGNTGTGSPVTHTYSSNGYYTVTLTATSTAPCSWTSTLVIHITNAALTYSCTSAHASFTHTSSGNIAYFTNTSTNPTSSQSFYSNYTYWYGDGTSGTSSSHSYASAGTYYVCLAMRWMDSLSNTQICYDSVCNSVTVTAPPNIITGTTHFDSSTCPVSSPSYKVWLITYNASTQILAAIDSVTSSSTSYTFTNKPAGTYRVKAMVTNATTSPAPLPTYGLDSLHWTGADSFAYSGTGISSGHNINMQCGTLTAGPGFVGGNVTLGANKGTKVTNGPSGVEILIYNASGTAIAASMTNNGAFSFSNLPVAPGGSTYTIYPEVLGYHNNPWSVTLYPGSDSATNINVTLHTISHYSSTTGIGNVTLAQNNIAIFPNPSTGIVNVTCTETAHAVVTDVVGHKVYEANVNNGNTQLNLSSLQSGMYFINILSADINYSNKIVLQR